MATKRLAQTVGFSLAFLAAIAFAQEGKPKQTSNEQVAGRSRPGVSLSAEEQLRHGHQFIETMKEASKHVTGLSNKSRRDNDLVKLNCVNGKLILVKGNLRLGEQVYDSLQSAVVRRDKPAAVHQFAKLTIAYQKVVVLQQEAEGCVGEELAYLGTTLVKVTISGNIRDIDPMSAAQTPQGGGGALARPPVASGSQ